MQCALAITNGEVKFDPGGCEEIGWWYKRTEGSLTHS